MSTTIFRRWVRRWQSGAYDIESVLRDRVRTAIREPDQFGEVIELHHRGYADLVARCAQDLRIAQLFGFDRCNDAIHAVVTKADKR